MEEVPHHRVLSGSWLDSVYQVNPKLDHFRVLHSYPELSRLAEIDRSTALLLNEFLSVNPKRTSSINII